MIKVFDIFCGAGGLSYGFANNVFFDIVAANDIDKDAATSYSLNHKNTQIIQKNIADLDKNDLVSFGNIDVLLGGPPCQSYSTLGKRQLDERANLFRQYLRVLKILHPKIFIFENVVGLISMQNGKLFKTICCEFEAIGYKLQYKILNVADFGVPQIRERVILVGVQQNIKCDFLFPQPTCTKYLTIREAIDDLPILKSGENGNSQPYRFQANNDFLRFVRNSNNILTEHSSPKNNPKLIQIMQTLKDGESKDALPIEIRPKSGYTNTYAKMQWNAPAPTITRNFSTPSSSRCIHPRDSRALSIREGARLQSFPDNYIFVGGDTSKRLQIGNAVPPLLSLALSNAVELFMREANV